ncbi:MAG: hypothetical protein PXX82_07170 [Methanomassiliicoccales archaeon]|nr:hypothetical protein [Methanomassiliicoccales archaeon]
MVEPMKARDLENDPRLFRILRTRSLLFGIQTGIIVLFALLIMLLNGLSLKPPYFPIYNVVLMVIFIVLILAVERIFFFRLSMKYGKRKGVMFLIAKRAFRTSTALTVLGVLFVAALFVANYTPVFDVHGAVSGNVGTAQFSTGTVFGLFTVSSVTINNQGGNNLTFVIVSSGDYLSSGATPQSANESLLINSNLAGGNDFVPAGGTTTAQISTVPNAHYYIVIFPSSGGVQARYTLDMKASPSILDAFILAIGIIPASGYLAASSRKEMGLLKSETIYT